MIKKYLVFFLGMWTRCIIVYNTTTNFYVNELTKTSDLDDLKCLSSYAVTVNKFASLIDLTEWKEINMVKEQLNIDLY